MNKKKLNKKLKAHYLELIQERYKKSDKRTKKKALDEFCKVSGYNRKYAIGLLQKPFSPKVYESVVQVANRFTTMPIY